MKEDPLEISLVLGEHERTPRTDTIKAQDLDTIYRRFTALPQVEQQNITKASKLVQTFVVNLAAFCKSITGQMPMAGGTLSTMSVDGFSLRSKAWQSFVVLFDHPDIRDAFFTAIGLPKWEDYIAHINKYYLCHHDNRWYIHRWDYRLTPNGEMIQEPGDGSVAAIAGFRRFTEFPSEADARTAWNANLEKLCDPDFHEIDYGSGEWLGIVSPYAEGMDRRH